MTDRLADVCVRSALHNILARAARLLNFEWEPKLTSAVCRRQKQSRSLWRYETACAHLGNKYCIQDDGCDNAGSCRFCVDMSDSTSNSHELSGTALLH